MMLKENISCVFITVAFTSSLASGNLLDQFANDPNYGSWVATYPNLVIETPAQDTDEGGTPDLFEMFMGLNPYQQDEVSLTPEEIENAYQAAKKCQGLIEGCTARRVELYQKAENLRSGTAWTNADGELISFEHLSDGSTFLLFRGSDSFTYDIEASDELDDWTPIDFQIPVVGGIGEWVGRTSLKEKFYRVRRTPSSGGAGSSGTDGSGLGVVDGSPGTLAITTDSDTRFEFTSTLGTSQLISSVALYVDGSKVGDMEQSGSDDQVWTFDRSSGLFPNSSHFAHAVAHADFETTPESGQTDFISNAGIRRTENYSFAPLNEGFHVSVDVDDISTTSPTGDSVATIRLGSNTSNWGCVHVRDPDGNIVHQEIFEPANESGGEPEQVIHESAFSNPSGVWGNYQIEAVWGEFGDSYSEPLLIVAGDQPKLTALMIYENSFELKEMKQNLPTFNTEFPPPHTIEGNQSKVTNLGPHPPLKSCLPITQDLKTLLRKHSIRLDCWSINSENCPKIGDPIPDPLPAFDAGGHAFGNHDMGFLMGHGTAWREFTNGDTGTTYPPSHYMLIGADRTTGEGTWLVSSRMTTRFGDGNNSKLKWMFLTTCNGLSDISVSYTNAAGGQESKPFFQHQQEINLLPIGQNLELLGGYSTTIYLDTELPKKFEEPLTLNLPIREAWLNTSQTQAHRDKSFKARTIAWPECNDNTLPGFEGATREVPLGGNRPHSALTVRNRG